MLSFLLALAPAVAPNPAEAGRIQFNRDIRPILSDKCFFCHGPDKAQRKADLRLDTREGLLGRSGEPGTVVSEKPAESELFQRIISTDASKRMPPPKAGKDLTESEKRPSGNGSSRAPPMRAIGRSSRSPSQVQTMPARLTPW
ncbi:MAG: c-type cytochrome domain-containing protein [Planctomycetota bacterium]